MFWFTVVFLQGNNNRQSIQDYNILIARFL